MTLPTTKSRGAHMGEIYADLTLTNRFSGKSHRIRTLVDTGATWMIITPVLARELGYDLDELLVSNVTVADGRRMPVPQIDGLHVAFHPQPHLPPDRSATLPTIVMGNQCLMGCVALQALDLILDPLNERIIGRHEGGPLYRA